MAYSRDAFIRDQQETRERQDQSETSVRLERDYRDMEDGLSQSNKIAGESQRDVEIWRMAYHSLTRQLERYGDMEDGLSQSNKIAGESQRDMEIWRMAYHSLTRQLKRPKERELETRERARDQIESQRDLERARERLERELETRERARQEIWSYLDILYTDRQTNGWTELFLKSLSRLKRFCIFACILFEALENQLKLQMQFSKLFSAK